MSNPKPHEITQAGDRSVLALIWQTLSVSQQQYEGKVPGIVWIDKDDAHLLAKELYDRRLTNDFKSRDDIEANITAGRLTLFDGIRIGVHRAH